MRNNGKITHDQLKRATKRQRRTARRQGRSMTWKVARTCAQAWERGVAGKKMWG